MEKINNKPVCNEDVVAARDYLHILYENTVDGQLRILMYDNYREDEYERVFNMNWTEEDCEALCDDVDELLEKIYSAENNEYAIECLKTYLCKNECELRALSLVPRCRKLKELGAPEIIIRNEESRLAEALAINRFSSEAPTGLSKEEFENFYNEYIDVMEYLRDH